MYTAILSNHGTVDCITHLIGAASKTMSRIRQTKRSRKNHLKAGKLFFPIAVPVQGLKMALSCALVIE